MVTTSLPHCYWGAKLSILDVSKSPGYTQSASLYGGVLTLRFSDFSKKPSVVILVFHEAEKESVIFKKVKLQKQPPGMLCEKRCS